ncbi:DUF2085 domain-containing protein [Amedibacillus sp. YH-ame10]
MKKFLYKWLPIIFGCHGRDERSFHYHGKKFPICARCTGELIGILVAIVSYWFFVPSILILICLMVPMLLDGFIQLLTKYESNNWRRFVTGFLFGYALCCLFFKSVAYVYGLGYAYGVEQAKKA